MSIKKHIPNILSTIRLIMALALPFFFTRFNLLGSALYYAIGNMTDFADGFLARKWHVSSKYGKVIDPLADKSLNIMALLFASLLIKPLFTFAIFESVIASINISRGINMLKNKNVNMRGMKLTKRLHLLFDTLNNMNVSIIGKIKSGLLGVTVFLSLLMPSLNAVTISLMCLTAGSELYVIRKYALEHEIEKQDSKYKTENIINLENNKDNQKQLSKLKKARTLLLKFNQLEGKIPISKVPVQRSIIKEKENERSLQEIDDFSTGSTNDQNSALGISKTLK